MKITFEFKESTKLKDLYKRIETSFPSNRQILFYSCFYLPNLSHSNSKYRVIENYAFIVGEAFSPLGEATNYCEHERIVAKEGETFVTVFDSQGIEGEWLLEANQDDISLVGVNYEN